MKIKQKNLYCTILHLKKPFKHGSFERTYNITLFTELIDEKGNKGYGESLAREYLTGEKGDDVYHNLKNYLKKLPDKFDSLDEISEFLYELEPKNSKNMASLCGVDMALLDLYSKSNNKSLSQILCDEQGYTMKNKPKITSAVLGLDTPSWKKELYCLAGFKDIKLKITPETNPEKINKVYSGYFKPHTFRLDGNCSFNQNQLENLLKHINVPVNYIEQPFKVGIEYKIDGARFLADESLVSLEDAENINFDAASVRIGKNGGILRALDIIKKLEQRDKPYVFGSLVGETSLLSSALLHLSLITNPFINEGCYSPILLQQDPTNKSLKPSYKGKINFNYKTPGLGINLDFNKTRFAEISFDK